MVVKLEILRKYFGYDSFRKGQEPLIDAQLSGRDAFGIMPTGGGKSICYQVPALLLEGITLVVSPLISLMKDQVMALKESGVAAAYINSSLTPEQIRLVYRNLSQGRYKLVYVAPERLLTDGFLHALTGLRIAMLAVDEAHCISQWGQDFRPSYLRIPEFLKSLPQRPVVSAFTATATPEVREDVIRLLELRDPFVTVTGFDRPNLRFVVQRPKKKADTLWGLLNGRRGRCGIVYCSTRKNVEAVCEMLRSRGLSATRYHAGLTDEERRDNQDDFVYDRCDIMVATNAFGMGINKSNVSFVIHYNMPQSMEAYYQEAGRAGRDGSPAECILLYSAGDVQTAKFLILHSGENEMLSPEELRELQKRDLARLEKMVAYCKTADCLRCYILDYFGEKQSGVCENCSNCDGEMVKTDITLQAQMILSGIEQVRRKLGYCVGGVLLTNMLRGSTEKRVLALKLDSLPAHGLMAKTPAKVVRNLLEQLEAMHYIQTHPEHGSISLTEKARDVLFGQSPVYMHIRVSSKKVQEVTEKPQPEEDLLAALKALRLRLAKEAGVPAYIVFSNATLQDMAAKAPRTEEAFLEVSGVGRHKASLYATPFLEEIRRYLDTK